MNILIVEDNDIQLQSLYKILSEKYTEDSFTYMLADNYDEAIRIINTNNIDIFILDIALSDNPNGGIDIARFIRFKKNMPCILAEYKHIEIFDVCLILFR